MMKLFSISCFLFLILCVHCIPTEQNKGSKKLSDEPHTNQDGEQHNAQYDHEAFLGKEEAAEFDSLPMEESMRRLRYNNNIYIYIIIIITIIFSGSIIITLYCFLE